MEKKSYKGYTIEPFAGRSVDRKYPGLHRILSPDGSIAHESKQAPDFATENEALEYVEAQARDWIDAHLDQ